jgi:hypothetical protein
VAGGRLIRHPLRETPARPPRFFQSIRPRTRQLHDLGAVHLALAA